MRFDFFNDTGRTVNVHPATEIHGTKGDKSPITHLSVRTFEIPDGAQPWVKLWDSGGEDGLMMLVSSTKK